MTTVAGPSVSGGSSVGPMGAIRDGYERVLAECYWRRTRSNRTVKFGRATGTHNR